MSDIFLSYSRDDRTRVAPLVDYLTSNGWDVWWDREIHPGQGFEESIDQQIQAARCIVVVWSKLSIDSRWVKNEALEGLDRNILVPILIDQVRVPVAFKQTLAADFTSWPDDVDDHEFQSFISAIGEKLGLKELSPPSLPAPAKRRSWSFVLLAAVILVTVVLGLYFFQQLSTPANRTHQIAILRFTDISNSNQTYLADALSSELYDRLRRIKGIEAVSQFASWDVPSDLLPAEVAQRLNTQFLLDGKLISSGSTDRLMVTLTDRNGRVSWEREYEVSANNVQQLTLRISEHALVELNIPFSTENEEVVSSFLTRSDIAYDHYLKGKDLLRQSHDLDILNNARISFEKAVSEDFRFVQAYSGLCRAYIALYENNNNSAHFESAEKSCNRALTLEPNEPDAYLALGNLYQVSGQPESAESHLLKALSLEPENVDAYIGLGSVYSDMKRSQVAMNAFNQAVKIQPGYWRSLNARGVYQLQHANYPEAIDDFMQLTLLNPDNVAAFNNLGTARYLNGEFEVAITAWKKSEAIKPGHGALSNIGTGYYYLRDYDNALQMYKKAIEEEPEDHRLWGNLADVQRMAKLHSQAGENYERAIELAVKVYAINNKEASTASRLAVYHAAVGNHSQAGEFIQRATTLDGNNPFVLYDLTIALIIMDSLDEAQVLFKKSMEAGFPALILNAEPAFDPLRLYAGKTETQQN